MRRVFMLCVGIFFCFFHASADSPDMPREVALSSLSGLYPTAPVATVGALLSEEEYRATRLLEKELQKSRRLAALGNVIHFTGAAIWLAGVAQTIGPLFDGNGDVPVSALRITGASIVALGPLPACVGASITQKSALRLTRDADTHLTWTDYGRGWLFVIGSNFIGIAGGVVAANTDSYPVLLVSAACAFVLSGIGEYHWARSTTGSISYISQTRQRLNKREFQLRVGPTLSQQGDPGLACNLIIQPVLP